MVHSFAYDEFKTEIVGALFQRLGKAQAVALIDASGGGEDRIAAIGGDWRILEALAIAAAAGGMAHGQGSARLFSRCWSRRSLPL
jgi:hypothetical protein